MNSDTTLEPWAMEDTTAGREVWHILYVSITVVVGSTPKTSLLTNVSIIIPFVCLCPA